MDIGYYHEQSQRLIKGRIKMYRITYRQGNGYDCSCCRKTSTKTKDVASKEKVIEWLNWLEAEKKDPSQENNDDICLLEISEIKDEACTDEFKADPEAVKAIIEKRRKEKEDAKKEEEMEETKNIENLEKSQLKYLAQKYPEELK